MADQEKLAAVLAGTVGYFWPVERGTEPRLSDDVAVPGFVREVDGEIELTLIREPDFPGAAEQSQPRHVVGFIGTTAASGVVIRDVVHSGGLWTMGGGRMSSTRYTAHTIVLEHDLSSVTSLNLASFGATFAGEALMNWADVRAVARAVKTDKHGRVKGVTLRLTSPPDVKIRMSTVSTLTLSADWSLDGMGTRIDMGLHAEMLTTRPRRDRLLGLDVMYVGDLLGVAYRGRVPIGRGTARLAGNMGAERRRLWTGPLMENPANAPIAADNAIPMFRLADMGGGGAVLKWIRLCHRHPRAVSPLLNRLRFEEPPPEVRILELASAMEYWVAVHRRSRVWAKKRSRRDTIAHAMTRYVGPSFGGWVGDASQWSTTFWTTYNAIKHQPSFQYSRRDLWILCESGRALLEAAMAKASAPRSGVEALVFKHFENRRLGDEVSTLL